MLAALAGLLVTVFQDAAPANTQGQLADIARLEAQARECHLSQLSRGDRAWAERVQAQAEAELQP